MTYDEIVDRLGSFVDEHTEYVVEIDHDDACMTVTVYDEYDTVIMPLIVSDSDMEGDDMEYLLDSFLRMVLGYNYE